MKPITSETSHPLKGKIFSVKQLCQELSVSRQTINNWQKTGILKPRFLGGRKYFLGADILEAFNQLNP